MKLKYIFLPLSIANPQLIWIPVLFSGNSLLIINQILRGVELNLQTVSDLIILTAVCSHPTKEIPMGIIGVAGFLSENLTQVSRLIQIMIYGTEALIWYNN